MQKSLNYLAERVCLRDTAIKIFIRSRGDLREAISKTAVSSTRLRNRLNRTVDHSYAVARACIQSTSEVAKEAKNNAAQK